MKKKTDKTKKPVNKGGRPKKTFDLQQVEKLGFIQCTQGELAAVLLCNIDTITRAMKDDSGFSEAYKRGLEQGKSSLRRKQFEMAMNGNCTMLIWLGKQYLGQSDKNETSIETGEKLTIEQQVRMMHELTAPMKKENANDSGQ